MEDDDGNLQSQQQREREEHMHQVLNDVLELINQNGLDVVVNHMPDELYWNLHKWFA